MTSFVSDYIERRGSAQNMPVGPSRDEYCIRRNGISKGHLRSFLKRLNDCYGFHQKCIENYHRSFECIGNWSPWFWQNNADKFAFNVGYWWLVRSCTIWYRPQSQFGSGCSLWKSRSSQKMQDKIRQFGTISKTALSSWSNGKPDLPFFRECSRLNMWSLHCNQPM